jgi:hypothetical protein
LDDRDSELKLLAFLQREHFASGNLEECLHFAQEARRLVFERNLSGDEHKKEKLKYVFEEAVCYINLNRFEDAEKVIIEYGEGIDDQRQLEILKKECSQRHVSYKALLELTPSSPLQNLRLESFAVEEIGR